MLKGCYPSGLVWLTGRNNTLCLIAAIYSRAQVRDPTGYHTYPADLPKLAPTAELMFFLTMPAFFRLGSAGGGFFRLRSRCSFGSRGRARFRSGRRSHLGRTWSRSSRRSHLSRTRSRSRRRSYLSRTWSRSGRRSYLGGSRLRSRWRSYMSRSRLSVPQAEPPEPDLVSVPRAGPLEPGLVSVHLWRGWPRNPFCHSPTCPCWCCSKNFWS